MGPTTKIIDPSPLETFVHAVGADLWQTRLSALGAASTPGSRLGSHLLQRHCIEMTIERLRSHTLLRPPSTAECLIAGYAASAVETLNELSAAGREQFLAMLRSALTGAEPLVASFHLLRTAAMQRARGFDVRFAAFEDNVPFDLLIKRGGAEAEIVCDVVSADAGHGIHRDAWFRLVDRVDPALQNWLRAHPGRYLLKMTLPKGLKDGHDLDLVQALSDRVVRMIKRRQHADGDETAMLRFDPLLLAAAQADELGLMARLRQEFGPEAHLSVVAPGSGVLVLAARAGEENEVPSAVRRRLGAVAPARLTGTRPGIVAMFIEDTDRIEWRLMREKLSLEGEIRQFMTHPEARNVVAVTCSSRLELFGFPAPDAEAGGELRFRNPAHPAAKREDLSPAVSSTG